MAKGFTVKANAPTKKKEEWDIAAIKERMRGKTDCLLSPRSWMLLYIHEELRTVVL